MFSNAGSRAHGKTRDACTIPLRDCQDPGFRLLRPTEKSLSMLGNEAYVAEARLFQDAAVFYTEQEQYDKALACYQQALTLQFNAHTQQYSEIVVLLQAMGWLYEDQKQYKQALVYQQRALAILNILHFGPHEAIAEAYQVIGWLYEDQHQYPQALDYHQRAFALLSVLYLEPHEKIANICQAIGWLHEDEKQYREALGYHQRALDILLALYIEPHAEVAAAYQAVANLHAVLEDPQNARLYYEKARRLRQILYVKETLLLQSISQILVQTAPVQLKLAKLEQAIAQGTDINALDTSHRATPLSLATLEDCPAVHQFLLFQGAKVNGSPEERATPLMNAAMNGYHKICKILLSRGAEINAKNHEGYTALMIAASFGDRHHICKLLIDYGADLNVVDASGRSALWIALGLNGYSETVEVLISHGAHLDEKMVHLAINSEDVGLCAYLLECGAPLPQDVQTQNAAILALLKPYQSLESAIEAIKTYPALIHFMREKKQAGDLCAMKRVLALKLGPLSYLQNLVNHDQALESFYEHLSQFAVWVQQNPSLVGLSVIGDAEALGSFVNDTQVLGHFSNYLWELFKKKPLKNVKSFQVQAHLEEACGLPRELTQVIWRMSQLGVAIPFHYDLAKKQIALQQLPGFPREDFTQRKHCQLIWGLSALQRSNNAVAHALKEPLIFSAGLAPPLRTQASIQENAQALTAPLGSLACLNREGVRLSHKRKHALI